MTIIEALKLCQTGAKVRPVCWRKVNPQHWVEYVRMETPPSGAFAEGGTTEEIRHALRLSFPAEFLGEREVVELDDQRRIKGDES